MEQQVTNTTRRYCVLFQLNPATNLHGLKATVPGVIDLVRRWSAGEMEQLCRSNDGQLFGYLLRSKKPPAMMRAEFDAASFTSNADSMMIFDVGDDFAALGFSRALTWLQRH